jgi:hypothetical protein
MEYPGQYLSQDEENEFMNYKNNKNKILEETVNLDKGHNKISREFVKQDGRKKQTKIDVYTSGDVGSNIRNAETGEYYTEKVGSYGEELYFKVIMATGEFKSRNNSSTLFYISPQHYMTHQSCEVNPEIISRWEERRRLRMNIINSSKARTASSVIVN